MATVNRKKVMYVLWLSGDMKVQHVRPEARSITWSVRALIMRREGLRSILFSLILGTN